LKFETVKLSHFNENCVLDKEQDIVIFSRNWFSKVCCGMTPPKVIESIPVFDLFPHSMIIPKCTFHLTYNTELAIHALDQVHCWDAYFRFWISHYENFTPLNFQPFLFSKQWRLVDRRCTLEPLVAKKIMYKPTRCLTHRKRCSTRIKFFIPYRNTCLSIYVGL
jgi:hypothetical protein